MRTFRTATLAVVLCVTLFAPRVFAAPAAEWRDVRRAVAEWRVDSTRVAEVHSLMIERDAGTFVLESGDLALALPLAGGVHAAVFRGRGSFRFEPRSDVEREQLERFHHTRTLRKSFTSLVLVFSDSTMRDLAGLEFRPDTVRALRAAWNDAKLYLLARRSQQVRPFPLAQALADDAPNDAFWAVCMDPKNEDPVFFALDPYVTERVHLGRRPEDDRYGLIRWYDDEVVCQGFAQGDPDTVRDDEVPPYEVTHLATDLSIGSDLKVRASAEATLRADRGAHTWFAFFLPHVLQLDSVTVGGVPQRFAQEQESDVVWVRCADALLPGESRVVRFRYHGEPFERVQDWIEQRHATSWYPDCRFGSRTTWDMAFHYPRDLQLVASGERVFDKLDGAQHHARWRQEMPAPWASFDVNFLEAYHVRSDSLPPLTVWIRHLSGAGKENVLDDRRVWTPHDDDERLVRDVARAVAFFQRELGPPQARALQAVETPKSVYEAFPGLIHLMLRKDQEVPGPENTPDVIRAHEIAHQWWGRSAAGYATYHDRWLAEGFADFSAIWYLQAGRHDTQSYLDVLEAWRKDLLGSHHYLLGDAPQSGPIWLGPRTASSATPDDYSLIIYEKGAWVLHMLRDYLLDDANNDESRFRGLLRGFHERWRGDRAFTEDFRAAASRAAGEDLSWFFDQWVYRTAIPTYLVHTETTAAEGGQWRVHLRIEQTNVPESFRMPVFVRLNFANGDFSRTRVWVTGRVTELDLPLAPKKPVEVVFNDLGSVLCDVQRVP